MATSQEFTVISYSDVCVELYGQDWWKTHATRTWAEECIDLQDYCSVNNYHYYGKCREGFNELEAIRDAKRLKKNGVVLDDLS